MTALLDSLRSGSFLTRQRVLVWAAALLIGFAAALVFLAATAHGVNDYQARPLGTDFSSFYAAGKYVREGQPESPFVPKLQYEKEQAIFGNGTPFFGWHNPPFFFLVVAPLAALPYLPALLVWEFLTLTLYLGALALILRRYSAHALLTNRLWWLLAIAFPAVFLNVIHGQNGLLTAGLLGGGIALLDERPVLSGVLFGLLAYKPQFGLMIPVALIATARWRVLGVAVLTVAALACAVTAVFGFGVWSAFLASTHFTRMVVLEQGAAGFYKMQSVFAAVRMLGGPIPLAYALQGVVSMAAAVFTIFVWRAASTSFADKGAALCLAGLLATPYCYDYDLVALAPAIALLATQGLASGFRPHEKTLLTVIWFVPIVARGVAATTFIPVSVIAMLGAGAFIATAIRAAPSSSAGQCSKRSMESVAPPTVSAH